MPVNPNIVHGRSFGTGLTEAVYDAVLAALENDSPDIPLHIRLLHPADIAELIKRLPNHFRSGVVQALKDERLGQTLVELPDNVLETLLSQINAEDLADAVTELPSDDMAAIVRQLEDTQADVVLRLIADRQQQKLAEYDRNVAGGIMQLELLAMPPSWTVGETLEHIRAYGGDLGISAEMVFIVGNRRKLIGTIMLNRLVRQPLEASLEDVMRPEPLSVQPATPVHDVVRLFEKYDLITLAVTDETGRLIGSITIDDVLDVALAEQDRDFKLAGGVSEGEDLFESVQLTTRRRFTWLLVNLVTAILASAVIAVFEQTIAQMVALAVLMPIIASMGGNAGTQTLTVTVRGLATGQITAQNAFYLLRKELFVGGLNGVLLGAIVATGAGIFYQSWPLAAVFFTAMVINLILAALSGHFLPIILQRLKFDPAVSAGVFVTTVTDVGGFFAFLGLAALFLL